MNKEFRLASSVRGVLLVALMAVFFLLLVGYFSAGGEQPSVAAYQVNESSVRVAYLYSSDQGTGEAFGDLLATDGYEIELIPLPNQPGLTAYLPVIASNSNLYRGAAGPRMAENALDLGQFDLLIIAHDTAGQWSELNMLAEQIMNSGKNVVAIGAGGAEFYLTYVQPDQGPANPFQGDSIVPGDMGASRPFYTETHAVDLGAQQQVRVLQQAGEAVALPLEQQPQLIRVGRLAGEQVYPLVLGQERFMLWGFVDGPDAMTGDGKNLFLNSLWFGASELAIPIAGTGFVPGAGIEDALLEALQEEGPQYALVQLNDIPTEADRQMLAEKGVHLQQYLAGTFYHALVEEDFNPDDRTIQEMVRWMGLLVPDFKLDPRLQGTAARDALSQNINTAVVHFHADVPPELEQEILAQVAQEYTHYSDHAYEIALDSQIFEALLGFDEVRWIGAGPVPPQDTNDGARAATGTDMVQNAIVPAMGAPTYLGLTGQGVTIAQFERKADDGHVDLSGRVTYGGEAHANQSSHATHVGGIMIGNGADSSNQGGSNRQWRGHAPGASLVSESYGASSGSALNDNFSDAINDYGAEVSNHSYVMSYGDYDAAAQGVDTLVRGDATDSDGDSIPARLAVWAAANQGDDAQYDDEEGFYSLYSPAKNSLTVGSIDSNDNGYSMFSSKGPTFDGRIKPDVMAPGCQNGGDGAITSTELGGGYTTKCGTSMAAPATTGVLALVLEQYHLTYGSGLPLPSTLKAVMVNTATDLVHTSSDGSDTNDQDLCRAQGPGGTPLGPGDPLDAQCWTRYGPGPDFATGYGAINAPAAVTFVRGKMLLEGSVGPGAATDNYAFSIPAGRDELRFTLAWDDEPGDSSLGVTVDQLVNDLDLRLFGPDGTHYPFVLDPLPANPSMGNGALDPIDQSDLANAYEDDNDRDNVEMILVENPPAGNWTLQVTTEGGFPTGDAQPYSVVGDMRTFSIVEPTTSTPADGGSKDDPATFLVILEAEQQHVSGAPDNTSTFADAVASDFEVRIDGTLANIVSGTPVGDQFWLMVRGQSGVYDPNYYDLEVTWIGYGQDTQTDGVLFLSRRVADRVIVLDHSGSMADYDKMPAAQNAARLFVDQSLEDDRIAVVGFSTNASSPYGIQVVSGGNNPPELTAAKGAINGLSPTNATAIGKGLLQGKSEIDTPGGTSEIRRMILLSDGMENVDPLYNTGAVKGVIQPTDIIVDTVAVGPSSAGLHTLLETIAMDNGGRDYHVTETGGGGTLLSEERAPDLVPNEWLLPATLENRLADQYKEVAELIRREQRLWQVSGDMQEGVDREGFEVQVDKGLATATFALNWNAPFGSMQMELRSPSGRTYLPGDADVIYRSDQTHETWIIREPEAGVWSVLLVNFKSATEYVAWLSAHTRVNFQILAATPPEARVPYNPIHILALATYGDKPLTDGEVMARVYGPDDSTWEENLKLFDDGLHGDGEKGDGIYGNWYIKGTMPGNYALRGRMMGMTPDGEPYTRYDNGTFHIRPLALYVHDGDRELGDQYKDLLQANGWSVDVQPLGDVPDLPMMQRYSLVIVGPETGRNEKWGTEEAFSHIIQHEIPVLGLNEGGYAFFGQIKLNIGFPNGRHGEGHEILPSRLPESIWRYPYDMTGILKPPLTLYQEPVPLVQLFFEGQEPGGVQVYGWDPDDKRYANIAMENRFFTLWGFGQGPEAMVNAGRWLFVNTAAFTAFGPRP